MLSIARRALSNIHRHVQDRTTGDAHQLILRKGWGLEMQAAKRADRLGQRLIVLDERQRKTGVRHGFGIVGFGEEPSMVAELVGCDKHHVGDCQTLDL